MGNYVILSATVVARILYDLATGNSLSRKICDTFTQFQLSSSTSNWTVLL